MIIFENSVPIEIDDNDPRAVAILELRTLALQQADAQKADDIRQERNALLQSSDWTMATDAPIDKNAWATYRQALRDISLQPEFPDNVTWPIKP